MSEMLDRLFPPDACEENILGGLPDYSTGGEAKLFFEALDPKKRDMVQWYLHQEIWPYQVHEYARGLVAGYHQIDPSRRFHDGLQSAASEIDRLSEYMDLFLTSSFFPKTSIFSVSARETDDSDTSFVEVMGWDEFAPRSGPFSLKTHQSNLSQMPETLSKYREFLYVPSSQPAVLIEVAFKLKKHDD